MSNANGFVIENGVLTKYTGPGGDVVVPEGVTSIGDAAFEFCNSLTDVTIPNGVTTIGEGAFSYCDSLTNVTIPDSVTTIGDGAFENCVSLTGVTIPDSVTSIGNSVFAGCESLTDVVIPKGVTSIGEEAFYGCKSLTSVMIPEGITSVGDEAFRDCYGLRSVSIPDSLTQIGDRAFYNCGDVVFHGSDEVLLRVRAKDFEINKGRLEQYNGPGGNITIPKGVTCIGDWAFSGCHSLMGVTIPDSVTSIGKEIFRYCDGLKQIVMPDGLKSLGKNPFEKDLPETLIPNIALIAPHMTEGDIKQYVLRETMWKKIPQDVRRDLFISVQSKSILAKYAELMDKEQADSVGRDLLKRLSDNPNPEEIAAVLALMTAFFDCMDQSLLQDLYDHLKGLKEADKTLKKLGKNQAVMDALQGNVKKDELTISSDVLLKTALSKERLTPAKVMGRLKKYYSMTESDLPEMRTSEGSPAEKTLTAWLLTTHEVMEEDWRSGTTTVKAAYEQAGMRHEASEIAAMMDPESVQEMLLKLADNSLGLRGRSKKMFLAYPICRYADEATMAELTKRAPKWRSSVSGNDAPPLATFRKACQYSNTRAAMLFAEKMGDLDDYARIRGTDADTLRFTVLADFSFDETGKKAYNLGAGTLTVSVGPDLTLSLFDDKAGKAVKSIPKKGADPEKYEAAKKDLDDLKKNVKKVVKAQNERLLVAFLDGHKFTAENWTKAYTGNPVLNAVARLVVWAQDGHTFTLSAGGPIDSAGQSYTITDKPIKVAHPMEMDAPDVRAWQKYFTSHGLKQPFAQIWEPVIDPKTIAKDRYAGCMIPYYRFNGQAKHGITVEDYDFHNDITITLADCDSDVERIDWRRHEIRMEDRFEVKSFTCKKYTRQVNHVVAYLDRITVWDRVRKDDVSVMELMDGFTLAQVTEFIGAAQKANAVNVLAALMDYKNTHFAEFDPMDEFVLE